MAKQAQINAVRPVLTAVDKGATASEKAIDVAVSHADKATSVVESGLETVADVVPEALDKSVHVAADATKTVVRGLRNPKTLAITIVVVSMAAGAGVGVAGYFLLKKRMEKEFKEAMEKEVDEMREFYIRRYKAEGYSTPTEAAETLLVDEAVDSIREYSGDGPEPAKPVRPVAATPSRPVQKVDYTKVVRDSDAAKEVREHVTTISQTDGAPKTSNVFVDGRPLVADDWDEEAEASQRQEGVPYVVSFEDVAQNLEEYEQVAFTYYEADDILANENDEVVEDVDAVVGVHNLGRFGHGSQDSNVVYVRNERLQMDIEIRKSTGEYAQEVHNLRHSDEPRGLRRARWGDHE